MKDLTFTPQESTKGVESSVKDVRGTSWTITQRYVFVNDIFFYLVIPFKRSHTIHFPRLMMDPSEKGSSRRDPQTCRGPGHPRVFRPQTPNPPSSTCPTPQRVRERFGGVFCYPRPVTTQPGVDESEMTG